MKMPSSDNRLERTIVPETIPLCTTLSVESQDIIINYAVGTTSLLDVVYKRVSAITGVARLVERPVERDTNA